MGAENPRPLSAHQPSPVPGCKYSRPWAQAVRGAGDHELAERRHEDQDEDGHQLNKHPQAALEGRAGGHPSWTSATTTTGFPGTKEPGRQEAAGTQTGEPLLSHRPPCRLPKDGSSSTCPLPRMKTERQLVLHREGGSCVCLLAREYQKHGPERPPPEDW